MIKSYVPFRHFIRICLICNIVFLCLLVGFESVPFSWPDSQAVLVAVQGGRSQRITKDILEMRYKVDSRAEAVGELETMLPAWEADQARLSTGLSPAAKTLLDFTSTDYTDIDDATRKILLNPNKPVDPLQAQIVVDHEWQYYTSSVQILAILSPEIYARKVRLLITEGFIDALLLFLSITLFVLVERVVHHCLAEQEKEYQQQKKEKHEEHAKEKEEETP
jgi:hypothetical protein